MKDECAGRPILQYVGLRPKMYSILEDNGSNNKKAKGVKKYVVKKQIKHEQFKQCLFNQKTFIHGMDIFRSVGHIIYEQHMNKISLSPFDSKWFILYNGVDTQAQCHSDVR